MSDATPATAAAPPLLELLDVSRRFPLRRGVLPRLLGRAGHVDAVRGVTLSLRRGGALGVVGESGSGKSTLANLILRLDQPTGGRIRFAGQDVTGLHGPGALRPYWRRAQMVFQDTGSSLNPRKTVGRALRESLRLAARPAKEASGLLRQVGLDPLLLARYPHELSGGQRQRVGIARALAMRPELLVADEPVSALDVSLQAQVLRLLMRLRAELDLTMVLITHDLALVHHLCDEVAVMQAGQVVEHGPTERVLRDPAAEYTRRLLEAVPEPLAGRQAA